MRFLAALICFALVAALSVAAALRPATATETALFKAALKNTQQDPEHWAYTETTVKKIGLGKTPAGETVVRFDPSKPYSDQFTVLKVEGRPPRDKDIKKYRARGEKRGEGLARAAARVADPKAPAEPAKLKNSGAARNKEVKADVDHPLVAGEEGERLIFEVPLISNVKEFPVEKIEVRVVVNRATRQVERGMMRVKESFRVKAVAKVKAGEGDIAFTVIDPKFNPVMTSTQGNLGASLLFVPVNATFASTRTDFVRVKPYNERLQVKLGPLELLDF